MKVLLPASEVAPIIKFGGLGDVVGALPKALEKIDVNVDVIVPYFSTAKTQGLKVYKSFDMEVAFDNASHLVSVYATKLPGSYVDVYLLKNSKYFDEPPRKAHIPETEKFVFFSRCVVDFIKSKFNTYDLIHCNDWHTGMITHLLEEELGEERPATLFTIHNLFYQGEGAENLVEKAGIAGGAHQLIDFDIKDSTLNLMFQGITSSDYISTVSPSYAREVLTAEYGGNFAETLQAREDRLVGILNGIDYTYFPRKFSHLNVQKYEAHDARFRRGTTKAQLKKDLKIELGLKQGDQPLFSFVSRLDPGQKGLDILYESVSTIVNNGGQFVLVGTGDRVWEEKFRALENDAKFKAPLALAPRLAKAPVGACAWEAKDNVSAKIVFDTKLANDVYQASDFSLIPSKYEPCGLTQMIAMWYGTLPIVREVGGLKDTVKHRQNGFVFKNYSSEDLDKAILEALKVYGTEKQSQMVEKAMACDFSWDKSAKIYKELYEKILAL